VQANQGLGSINRIQVQVNRSGDILLRDRFPLLPFWVGGIYAAGMGEGVSSSDVTGATSRALGPEDFFKAPTDFLRIVTDPARWAALRELAAGQSCSVVELAGAVGRSADLMSKHLKTLREAGAVVLVDPPDGDGRKQHYAVAEQFRRVEAGKPVLDYGVCVLRFS